MSGSRSSMTTTCSARRFVVVADGSDALAAADICAEAKPDVLLVDMTLPGPDGIAATRAVLERCPQTRVLMLSMHAKPEIAVDAFVAGVSGYAVKSQRIAELIDAIRQVARGGTYLAPVLPRLVLDTARRRKVGGGDTRGPIGALSEREREVFRLAVSGMSNDGIAAALSVSVKTVETHRAHINRKLGLHSPAELVRFAASHGLLLEA
jgi:DNA-binding NarL/FixJ family response regulator